MMNTFKNNVTILYVWLSAFLLQHGLGHNSRCIIPIPTHHHIILAAAFKPSLAFQHQARSSSLSPVLGFCREATKSSKALRSSSYNTQHIDHSSDRQQPETTKQVPPPKDKNHTCKFCSRSFPSRNALFRHVRSSDAVCSSRKIISDDSDSDCAYQRVSTPTTIRQTVAFKIAYYRAHHHYSSLSLENSIRSEAAIAGAQLRSAVKEALLDYIRNELDLKEEAVEVEILSSTQVSLASQRHKSLSQEIDSAASGDVVIMSFMAPGVKGSGESDRPQHQFFLTYILKKTNERLERVGQKNDITSEGVVQVHVVACKLLSNGKGRQRLLHAENDCTQRIYHYLLPLKWLPQGNELEQWWLSENENNNDGSSIESNKKTAPDNDGHTNRFRTKPPSDSLRRMIKALRKAVSTTIPNRRVRRREYDGDDWQAAVVPPTMKLATGRYGLLARKERRPFHNFADPNLRGDASPNNAQVWRVLDGVKIVRLFGASSNCGGGVTAEIEFRGDDFLPEQIRRIIGTATAMSHGWLPPNTFDVALCADTFLETACAPPGRLYLQESRFHFDQLLVIGKKGFFEHGTVVTRLGGLDGEKNCSFMDATDWIQDQLLKGVTTEQVVWEEDKWLNHLQDSVAPRIRNQISAIVAEEEEAAASDKVNNQLPELLKELGSAPEIYMPTLKLLREIVQSNAWPNTSAARSSVIRQNTNDAPTTTKDYPTTKKQQNSGSFTVVNPKKTGSFQPPLGNRLFPDLANAVFELEEALSSEMELVGESARQRSPSSHCAINCNAQFTPHVDSGRGSGQSLSMIVGLGDYIDGELGVEGTFHAIRYIPFEFDGWKMRHWTRAYRGERFSLVWFTPAEFS